MAAKRKHHAHIVKWRDSASLRGWRSPEDPNAEVSVITTVGWLVKRTPKTITLTTSISDCGNICDPITIPVECCIKISKLKYHIVGE